MSFLKKVANFFGFGFESKPIPTPPQETFAKKELLDESKISHQEIKTFIDRGELDKAKQIIDRERKITPDKEETRFLHAHWLRIQNRHSEAEQILLKLIEKNPQLDYLTELVQAYYAQNKLNESWKLCQEIFKKDPENRDALIITAKTLLSQINPEEKEEEKSTNLKNIYKAQTGHFNELANLAPRIKKLIEKDPADKKAIEILAEIYSVTNNQTELEKLMSDQPSEFINGKIKLMRGDFSGAADIFQKLVNEDNQNVRRLQNLALAEEQSGNLDKALDLFQKELQLNPHSLTARRHFQHLAVTTEDPQALLEFEKSIPENNSHLSALYATILDKRGDDQKALHYYTRAIDAGLDEPTIIHHFARLVARAVPKDKAVKILEKLAKKYPDDQKILDIYLEIEKQKMK